MSPGVFYKLYLKFQGTQFYGWQVQPNQRTVQGELNKALGTIFKTSEIKTIGSGRTDTGVHSRSHVVKVHAPFSIEPQALIKGLNSLLPKDIVVTAAEFCSADFLPTNDAKSKEYFYLFSNLELPEVMMENMMANVTFDLDFSLMQQACKAFIGTHDFKGFMCTGSEVNSTIRTIYSCEIEYFAEPTWHFIVPPHYKITVVGNGFLKQMVRLIVGSIWEVGRGKIQISDIQAELKQPGHRRIAPVAPAVGLYKSSVTY